MKTRELTKMAICIAVICVSAYLSFPLPFTTVPFTCLTLSMLLAAFVLTPRQTLIVLAVYLLLGSAGLPVFAGGRGGIGEFASPGGGYLIGFFFAYPLISYFKGRSASVRRFFFAGLLSIPITYFFGVGGLCLLLKVSVYKAFVLGALPFIVGDVIKAFIAAYIGAKLYPLLPH